METGRDPRETDREAAVAALREAERAAAAPYLSSPDLPRWYPLAAGAWFSAMLLTLAAFVRDGTRPAPAAALVVLLALELWFLAWLHRRHGALPWPGFGSPPPEIDRAWRAWFVGCGVVVAVVALVWWLVGAVVAAASMFVLVTGGTAWYERTYVTAAAALRERLA